MAAALVVPAGAGSSGGKRRAPLLVHGDVAPVLQHAAEDVPVCMGGVIVCGAGACALEPPCRCLQPAAAPRPPRAAAACGQRQRRQPPPAAVGSSSRQPHPAAGLAHARGHTYPGLGWAPCPCGGARPPGAPARQRPRAGGWPPPGRNVCVGEYGGGGQPGEDKGPAARSWHAADLAMRAELPTSQPACQPACQLLMAMLRPRRQPGPRQLGHTGAPCSALRPGKPRPAPPCPAPAPSHSPSARLLEVAAHEHKVVLGKGILLGGQLRLDLCLVAAGGRSSRDPSQRCARLYVAGHACAAAAAAGSARRHRRAGWAAASRASTWRVQDVHREALNLLQSCAQVGSQEVAHPDLWCLSAWVVCWREYSRTRKGGETWLSAAGMGHVHGTVLASSTWAASNTAHQLCHEDVHY